MADVADEETAAMTGLPVDADTTVQTPPNAWTFSPRVVFGAVAFISLTNQ